MISGEKTIIKGITKESVMDIYRWVNQEELRSYTGTLYPVSEYEHEDWIKKQVTSLDRKLFLICDKKTNCNIGTIGLKNFDYVNSNAELFVSIGEDTYIEGGYGTDAVRVFVKYCFEHLNLHKIYLQVFESNGRAIRCYEKVGFRKEGILVDHHFQKGKYENIIFMGITFSS